MLSFLQQLANDGAQKVDTSTSGESAHVYTGGQSRVPRDTTRIRVDRSARHLDGRVDYGHIFSLELPESIMSMDANLTQGTSCLGPSKVVMMMQTALASYKGQDVFKGEGMRSLRNVAFPPDLSDKDLPTFDTASTDLGRVLPAKRNYEYLYRMKCNGYALRERFVGLPLHRVCYYHSHDPSNVAIRNLSRELGQYSGSTGGRDCIGMTPLHILACSTKHHLDMYQMLIMKFPDDLFAQDAWGCLPILYAFWGRAQPEVVELLAKSMKEHDESYRIDWENMIETLCMGMAPTASIQYLIEMNRSIFPDQTLKDVDWNYMTRILCTKAKAPEEHVRKFIALYRDSFPAGNSSDLAMVSLKLSRKEKFGFKPFWLRVGISERLALLDKEEWKVEIESMIANCPTGSSERIVKKRYELMKAILRKLDQYELLAQMWVLELALWKAKIGEAEGDDAQSQSYRSCCRFTSGADVIIPNVIQYHCDLTLSYLTD